MTIKRGFALDRFQEEAIAAVDAGRSVLVAAPTSSGKTVVAEHAVELALAAGRRAFYTTPIKALSNQKFRDLGDMFGHEKVGLMTGDQVVAPDAPVVVMTTEVLRNMLYAGSSAVDDLAWVVLDEVHFLEDPYRGAVWEEVLLHLAPTVGIVALSATVSNAAELGDWVTSVRGPTDVIVETRRPVRLRAHYLVAERGRQGSSRKVHRTALLAKGGKPNPSGRRFDQEGRHHQGSRHGRGRGGPWVPPRRNEVVAELAGADLLPAIHFIFSRAGCDEARDTVVRDGLVLNDDREAAAVDAHLAERLDSLGEADRLALRVDHWADALRRGIASHHAGLVPLFKEVTEELFIAGLVKLVYATETLALGVNLPARSVVIDRLTKFTGETHEVLTPGQFTQLTGRAGRRGLDVEGHALVCWSPFVPFDRVAGLAGSRDFVLRSAFRPTYNMVANMVEGRTRAEAVDLLARSFAQFQVDRRTSTRLRRTAEKRDEAERLRGRLDGEDRRPAVVRSGGRRVSAAVLRPGDVVVPDDGLAHVVLSVANRGGGRIRVRTLAQDGRVAMLADGDTDGDDLVGDPELVGQMDLPVPFVPDDRGFRREAGRRLAGFVVEAAAPANRDHGDRLSSGGSDQAGDRKRLARLERDLAREAERPADVEGDLTARFDAAFDVLSARGMVDGWSLTRRGMPLTQIHNEADLLVAEVLDAGILRGLGPSMTAAVVSCLTYRKRGPGDPSTIRLGGPFPDSFGRLTALAEEVAAAESEAGFRPADPPDPGFAHCIHAWAGGAELGDVLDDDLPAGEFVRNVRLVADLLRQVAATAGPEVAAAALEAQEGIDRGVIAMSSGRVDADEDPEDAD